ncbi:MAG: hypothetical protein BWY74_03104 [Firmicutes bacterium ADurb.Bin419]|nr:MAG: hypothetical protein BWY74_03104 [Firmicutes bacterium ADurb.Bin419]
MSLLVLNIYEEKTDFSKDKFHTSQEHLYENTYILPDSLSDSIEHDVLNLILQLQGDGFRIYTSKHKQICYMDIYLLIESYKLDVIIAYFNSNFQTANSLDLEEEVEDSSGLISISGHIYDGIYEDIEKVLSEALGELNVSYKIIKKESNIFERGTGAEVVGIIISLIGLAAIPIWDKLKQNLEQKEEFKNYVKYGEFNIKKLLLNFAYTINDPNIKNYRVDNFEKRNDGKYDVVIRGKNKRYDIVCDQQANILDISIY